MSKAMFMKPVVEKLGQGSFFRSKFALLVRVMAVLLAVVVLWTIINTWRGGLSDAPGADIAAGIIVQLFLIIGAYMAVHAMFLRARDIGALLEGPHTVIPIVSIFLKMLGEIYASLMIAVAVGGTLATWIRAASPKGLLRELEPLVPSATFVHGIDNAFFAGLAFMITGIVAALLWLVFFYFLSEAVTVLGEVGAGARRRP